MLNLKQKAKYLKGLIIGKWNDKKSLHSFPLSLKTKLELYIIRGRPIHGSKRSTKTTMIIWKTWNRHISSSNIIYIYLFYIVNLTATKLHYINFDWTYWKNSYLNRVSEHLPSNIVKMNETGKTLGKTRTKRHVCVQKKTRYDLLLSILSCFKIYHNKS